MGPGVLPYKGDEEIYRTAVDSSADAILRLDATGICRWASPASSTVFGIDPVDLIGRAPVRLLVHPDDAAQVGSARERTLNGEQAVAAFRIRRPGGEVAWIENQGRPVRDGSGAVTGFVVVCRDVTLRIRAEQAVAQSEELHRALIQALPGAAMLVVDEDLRIELATGSGLERAGWRKEAVEGRLLAEIVPPQRWAVLEPTDRAAFHQTQSFTIEVDGGHVWTQLAPLSRRADQKPAVVVIAQDVTERTALARAASRSEQRFRSAFDDAPIGMGLLDAGLRFERANAQLCAMLDIPVGTLAGMPLDAALAPEDRAACGLLLHETVAGQRGGFRREVRLLAAGGAALWVSLHVTALDEGDGQRVLMLQAVDISERHRIAEALQFEADHDPLTGLMNRRSFERALDEQATRVARYGCEGAVLMMDLDGFKQINDTLGHATGDGVLAGVAQAIRTRLRESDPVARLGGDEFGVLLPKASRLQAGLVAAAILEAIRGADLPGPGALRGQTGRPQLLARRLNAATSCP